MWKATGFVVFLAVWCLAGCHARPAATPAGSDAGFGGWSWHAFGDTAPQADDVVVHAAWGSWNKKFVYVILTDDTTAATTQIDTSGAHTDYRVNLTFAKGQKAVLRIATGDGKTGSIIHDGRSYDLAHGAILVLQPAEGKLQVRQLQRDISSVTAGIASVQKLVQGDQEIARIFTKGK